MARIQATMTSKQFSPFERFLDRGLIEAVSLVSDPLPQASYGFLTRSVPAAAQNDSLRIAGDMRRSFLRADRRIASRSVD